MIVPIGVPVALSFDHTSRGLKREQIEQGVSINGIIFQFPNKSILARTRASYCFYADDDKIRLFNHYDSIRDHHPEILRQYNLKPASRYYAFDIEEGENTDFIKPLDLKYTIMARIRDV